MAAGRFRDHFSDVASAYARCRPRYPPALLAWLAASSVRRELAWDCATGNGQAAEGLARHFARVVATDASRFQLAHVARDARVAPVAALAESAPLPARCVDLVTVAQALHWFEPEPFYEEVRRVARPGARIAVWSYALARVDPDVDAVVARLHDEVLAEDWPPRRRHVVDGYRAWPFPFDEIAVPRFEMSAHWTRDRLVGYLATWSAVRRHRARTGGDPLVAIQAALERAWPDGSAPRRIVWPLAVRCGSIGDRAPARGAGTFGPRATR